MRACALEGYRRSGLGRGLHLGDLRAVTYGGPASGIRPLAAQGFAVHLGRGLKLGPGPPCRLCTASVEVRGKKPSVALTCDVLLCCVAISLPTSSTSCVAARAIMSRLTALRLGRFDSRPNSGTVPSLRRQRTASVEVRGNGPSGGGNHKSVKFRVSVPERLGSAKARSASARHGIPELCCPWESIRARVNIDAIGMAAVAPCPRRRRI